MAGRVEDVTVVGSVGRFGAEGEHVPIRIEHYKVSHAIWIVLWFVVYLAALTDDLSVGCIHIGSCVEEEVYIGATNRSIEHACALREMETGLAKGQPRVSILKYKIQITAEYIGEVNDCGLNIGDVKYRLN